MDAKGALRAVVKYWMLFSVVLLAGIAVSTALVLKAKPKYESTVTFFVSTPTSDDAASLAASDQFASRRVNSYVKLASSDLLADRVRSSTSTAVKRTLEPTIRNEISASADLNTVLLTVRVKDPTRARSLEIATSVTRELPILIDSIDNDGNAANKIKLTATSGPRLNPHAIRPSRLVHVGLGVVGGLLGGLALVIMLDLLDKSVRSATALRDLVDLPVLGVIGFDALTRSGPLVVGRQARSVRAEAMRGLRTNLQFMHVDEPVQVLVVTSSVAGEGKSTVAANLAIVFAETGKSVLLIEADLRRPRVTSYLDLEGSVGLSNVLAGQVGVDDVLQPWGDGRLVVLASGTVPPNPSEMLGSKGMSDLVAGLRDRFDLIIIDTPPVMPVTDAAVASVHADGVLVVVRFGKTGRAQISGTISSLRAVDAPVLGTVLNMAARKGSARERYDGYGYYEDADQSIEDVRVRIAPAEVVPADSSGESSVLIG